MWGKQPHPGILSSQTNSRNDAPSLLMTALIIFYVMYTPFNNISETVSITIGIIGILIILHVLYLIRLYVISHDVSRPHLLVFFLLCVAFTTLNTVKFPHIYELIKMYGYIGTALCVILTEFSGKLTDLRLSNICGLGLLTIHANDIAQWVLLYNSCLHKSCATRYGDSVKPYEVLIMSISEIFAVVLLLLMLLFNAIGERSAKVRLTFVVLFALDYASGNSVQAVTGFAMLVCVIIFVFSVSYLSYSETTQVNEINVLPIGMTHMRFWY